MRDLILLLLRLLLLFQPLSGYECGRRQMLRSKIIGGNEAPLGKWPWQVRLDMGCGGTIIAPRWILTAGHCFRYVGEYSRSEATVAYGTITGSFTDGNNTIRSKNVIVHEAYEELAGERGKLLNDITLLELEEPISFDRFVQLVCLPSKNTTIPRDAIVIATGFGRWNAILDRSCYCWQKKKKKKNKLTHKTLLETNFPLIPRDFCRGRLSNYTENIANTQLCGGAFGHGTAPGDSGGPVVMKTKEGAWFKVGITSWGFAIDEQDTSPGVYTNVHKYCDWIEEKTGGEAKCQDAVLIDATAEI